MTTGVLTASTGERSLAAALYPYVMFPGIVGEVTLTFWLLVKGVNVERWNEQARATEHV